MLPDERLTARLHLNKTLTHLYRPTVMYAANCLAELAGTFWLIWAPTPQPHPAYASR